jgi:hypothetical protein
MKMFTTIKPLELFSPEIATHMLRIHSPDSDLDFHAEYFTFSDALGGDIFVVDTQEEAEQVVNGQLFDIIEDLPSYRLYWLANNNAGGPTYFVPKALVATLTPDPDSSYYFDPDPILSVIPNAGA